MDVTHDMLADGTKIRLLTIVDCCSRESLALEVGIGFKSTAVVAVLQRVCGERGRPQIIRCDNGPEFVSVQLDQWAYWNNVTLDFSRPGTPSDNAFCESFNNRVRQELLNPNWFAIDRRSTHSSRCLAHRLQRQPSAQLARESQTGRVRLPFE
jgi:putative transposase